jgi:hypothetical protein
MSYDVSLYDASFLQGAISSGLGDWTGAPVLPASAMSSVIQLALTNNFSQAPRDPKFVAFMESQGVVPSSDYQVSSGELRVNLQVFKNSVVFSVPPSNVATASVGFVRRIALQLAKEHGLGFYDPQAGEVLCEPV